MPNKVLTLTARPVVQGDVTFYETGIAAADLLNEEQFDVDRWNNSSQRGYQREINDPHTRRIAQYLKGNTEVTNVMPTPIVVNCRGNIRVTPLGEGSVQINLPADEKLYVVDGQHRIEAVHKVNEDNESILEDYEFAVVLTNFSLEQEMIHFKLLNATANRPARGLSQVIGHQLSEMTGVAPVTYTEQQTNAAVGTVIRLAVETDSPLYGKIAIGGIRKRSFHTTVQASVVNALLPMYLTGRFSDTTLKMDATYEYVSNFWKAVEQTWPEAWGNPESSTIQRTIGLTPLAKVMNKIFNNLTINPSYEDYVRILKDIRDIGHVSDEDWATLPNARINSLRHGYSMGRGNTIVADYLWNAVDTKAFVAAE